jgi:hypothetical protein
VSDGVARLADPAAAGGAGSLRAGLAADIA